MILALDGPPDTEETENTRLLKEFEDTSKKIAGDLAQVKNQLTDRVEQINDKQWY